MERIRKIHRSQLRPWILGNIGIVLQLRAWPWTDLSRETPPVLGPYWTYTRSRALYQKRGTRTACQRKPVQQSSRIIHASTPITIRLSQTWFYRVSNALRILVHLGTLPQLIILLTTHNASTGDDHKMFIPLHTVAHNASDTIQSHVSTEGGPGPGSNYNFPSNKIDVTCPQESTYSTVASR